MWGGNMEAGNFTQSFNRYDILYLALISLYTIPVHHLRPTRKPRYKVFYNKYIIFCIQVTELKKTLCAEL